MKSKQSSIRISSKAKPSNNWPEISIKRAKTNYANSGPRIIISKKVVKKAVDRNRIKRVIKEVLKDLDLNNKEGLKIIVKKNIFYLKKDQIKGEITKKISNFKS